MPPNIEPTWFCHECGSDSQPLMVPDPHCASCNGTFVEMVESQQDDPRAWRNMRQDDDGDFDDFPAHLRDILPGPTPGGGGGFTMSIGRSSSPGGNTRTFIFGRPGQTDAGLDRVMPLTEFLAETAGDRGGRTTRDGPGGIPPRDLLLNQIFGAMNAQRHADQRGPGGPNLLANILGMPQEGLEGGRFGDYVLNQQALDQIANTLLENSGAHRPAAATEEVLEKLNRDVLVEGSLLLEKSCAVCKDQFALQTEDPDEQIVITLPCKHPFHSPCILPWLKQNGTCPSCRYQLVTQPGSTQNPNNNSGSTPGPSTSTTNPPQPTSFTPAERNSGSRASLLTSFGHLLHSLTGGHPNTAPASPSSDSGPGSVPGSWEPHPSSSPEPRRPQPPSSEDQPGPPFGSSYSNSDRWDHRGGSIDEWNSQNLGSYRRGSRDSESGRRDRTGQRRYPPQPGLD